MLCSLNIARYLDQAPAWPVAGRHILAQFNAESIVVYQAYKPTIASYAVTHQRFGGEFSFNRMSWIKPNFLWMMYRSGWATKEGQEHILAISITRRLFDEILRRAVPSTINGRRYASNEAWRSALAASEVRLQWDPDHDPRGRPLARRAIQLGLRGAMLRRVAHDEALSIEDITPFVRQQRTTLSGAIDGLETPAERVYVPADGEAARAVGLDAA
jgi:hypothetical protein